MAVSLVHQHLICKAYGKIFHQSQSEMNNWLTRLAVDILKMKVCIPARSVCVTDEGNYGYTGLIGLSTSHISCHNWSEYGYLQLDIYSCKRFNSSHVFNYLKDTLGTERVAFSVYDRDNRDDFQHEIIL